jgi:hypothetical protein
VRKLIRAQVGSPIVRRQTSAIFASAPEAEILMHRQEDARRLRRIGHGAAGRRIGRRAWTIVGMSAAMARRTSARCVSTRWQYPPARLLPEHLLGIAVPAAAPNFSAAALPWEIDVTDRHQLGALLASPFQECRWFWA